MPKLLYVGKCKMAFMQKECIDQSANAGKNVLETLTRNDTKYV